MAAKYGAIFGTKLQMPGPAGKSTTRERPRACIPPPSPPPTRICSHICTWPSSWTSQTHAPKCGFGSKAPWTVFTGPRFSAAVCSQQMMDVGCVALLSGLRCHLDSIVYRFCTCFRSHGPGCGLHSPGRDSSVSGRFFLSLHFYQPTALGSVSSHVLVFLVTSVHPLREELSLGVCCFIFGGAYDTWFFTTAVCKWS